MDRATQGQGQRGQGQPNRNGIVVENAAFAAVIMNKSGAIIQHRTTPEGGRMLKSRLLAFVAAEKTVDEIRDGGYAFRADKLSNGQVRLTLSAAEQADYDDVLNRIPEDCLRVHEFSNTNEGAQEDVENIEEESETLS